MNQKTNSKIEKIAVPLDFQQILNTHKDAKEIFEKLSNSHKREYIQWIEEAKKLETRNKRMFKTLEMLIKIKK